MAEKLNFKVSGMKFTVYYDDSDVNLSGYAEGGACFGCGKRGRKIHILVRGIQNEEGNVNPNSLLGKRASRKTRRVLQHETAICRRGGPCEQLLINIRHEATLAEIQA
ncbi:MAG: hypothetical protein UY56_C0005G0039 [Parcubacteria group bacterium GW2011_GWA1_50_14]|nr:MAG: hypothetical protein UY56_C0005G0039 [Parcubacteria group bacterium GW2011_GWA1_50_14]